MIRNHDSRNGFAFDRGGRVKCIAYFDDVLEV